ncbi:MAG: hypothetical protein ACM3IH_11975 [Sphingobacteriales bacterium]
MAPGSKLTKVEDANAAGVRIGGVANTATFRAAQRTAPKATFVTVPGGGRRDCRDESRRDRLHRAVARVGSPGSPRNPGSRILDGGFLNSSTAVAVPKGRPDALAYVSEFIEEGKGRGSGPKFPGCDEPEKFPGGAGRDETLGVACYVR